MKMISIQPGGPARGVARAPGSKSLTNRALICAAACSEDTLLRGPATARDSRVMVAALRACGVPLRCEPGAWTVTGLGGGPRGLQGRIDVGEAGTVARFLPAFLAAGEGDFIVDGSDRMRQRPMRELQHALLELGASVEPCGHGAGLPWRIRTSGLQGAALRLNAGTSSQFVSALLMVAPLVQTSELEILLVGASRSRPYIAMTRSVMAAFGARVEQDGESLRVPAGQRYRSPGIFDVEVDASGAAFFLAAAAMTGGAVRIPGLHPGIHQGDLRMVTLLEEMGAVCTWKDAGVEVAGRARHPIDVDLGDHPDLAPPLAAVAVTLAGRSFLRNLSHLRVKESDRLANLARELSRSGARVEIVDEGLRIEGPASRGARFESYGDHRLAMAFSLLGLILDGVFVSDPECVSKSMPEYFELLEALVPGCRGEAIDA